MKSTKNSREFARRKRNLKRDKERYRYPFGLLTVLDLICGKPKRLRKAQ